jgi:hypothetical protein
MATEVPACFNDSSMGMRKLALCVAMSVAPVASAQTVKVRLEAPSSVALEEDAYDRWVPICVAPCDRELDVRGVYRIGGNDVQRKRIDITPKPGDGALHVRVEPGSRAANIVGAILTPVGAGAVIAGLLLTIGGGDWITAGAATTVAGGITGVVGAILIAVSQTTITF